jgi:LCP family protein required for cell wall assembly
MSKRKAVKTAKKVNVVSVILSLLMLLGGAAFIYVVHLTKMVPAHLMTALYAGCLFALIVTILLTRGAKRKVRLTIGVIWTVLCLAVYTVGGYYLYKTQDSLKKTTQNKETTNVSFYVSKDDPAESLEDAEAYSFGILKVRDRQNTDNALDHIKQEKGMSLSTEEYNDLNQLADALLDHEIDGIILNEAYLGLYEDSEEYADFPKSLKILYTQTTENVVETSEPVGEVINIYISGSDTRDKSLPARSRSDVNIIASVNTKTHEVLLLSTPRDYFVPLSISDGIPDKLTHAGIYGVEVSMDTLSMIYGIDIDYYFRINFTGFVDIIDALGGIEVDSDYAFRDWDGKFWFEEGLNSLNGEQALAFARERHAFPDGDFQRGRNQMKVITAVMDKALSPSILTSYTSILDSVQGYMETNIPYDFMAKMVRQQLSDNKSWDIQSFSVTGTGDYQIPYSDSQPASVIIPDDASIEEAKEKLAQVAD